MGDRLEPVHRPDVEGAPATDGDPSESRIDRFPGAFVLRFLPSLVVLLPCWVHSRTASALQMHERTDEHGRWFLTYPGHPARIAWLGGSAVVVLWLLLLAWSFARRWSVRPWPWFVGLAILPGSCVASFGGFQLFSPALDATTIRLDGVGWRSGVHGLADLDVLLAREAPTRDGRTEFEVVATRSWERPRAQLLRPAGVAIRPIVRSARGLILVVSQHGTCDVAWHPSIEDDTPPWPPGSPRDRRDFDPLSISPFELIGPDGTGDPRDVEAVLATIRLALTHAEPGGQIDQVPWFPQERVLLDALDDPNPWIRETASRFVREGGEKLYPTAVKRL